MTLTREQIEDGWKPFIGSNWSPKGNLTDAYQLMYEHDGEKFFTGVLNYASEPVWDDVIAYRTFSPDTPSPVREAVAWRWRIRDATGWMLEKTKPEEPKEMAHIPAFRQLFEVEPLGVITPTTSDSADTVSVRREALSILHHAIGLNLDGYDREVIFAYEEVTSALHSALKAGQ